MKYKPSHPISSLQKGLAQKLKELRQESLFSPEKYLQNKCFLIEKYLKEHKIKVVVVGLSGGIDSSLVLALLKFCKEKNGHPQTIVPVMLPVEDSGVSNQKEAVEKGLLVCKNLSLQDFVVDLTKPFNQLREEIEKQFKIKPSDWAKGQLTPYLRTPTLYYITTLLLEKKGRTVLFGTTNRSEGAYLGYIGKASDALVDIQPISDLYKSEVFSLASYLKLPEKIIRQIPAGDMFDNRSDEEVFGASYDFVELFLRVKKKQDFSWVEDLNKEEKEQWVLGCKNLEDLHNFNLHKYIGHSPAVHLDIFDTYIKGGWINNSTMQLKEREIDFDKIVNLVSNINSLKAKEPETKYEDFYFLFKDCFDKNSIKKTIEKIKQRERVQAGQDGYVNQEASMGSKRLSFISKSLAEDIFSILKNKLPKYKIHEGDLFETEEVSSLFRVIEYTKDDLLVPHIDHSYEYNHKKKTLMSVVICLEKNGKGGDFSFVVDKEKDGKDWKREASPEKIKKTVKLEAGDIVLFDHGLLHQSSKVWEGEKMIIRTDLVFTKRG